jgi:integrase
MLDKQRQNLECVRYLIDDRADLVRIECSHRRTLESARRIRSELIRRAVGTTSHNDNQRCAARWNSSFRGYLLVLLAGEAGLRLGEMVALKWSDINFAKNQVCVQRSAWRGQIASPKGGRLRYVPLTTRLAAALREHRHLRGPLVLYQDDGSSPLTEGLVQGFVQRAARRVGLQNNGPHMLRHTFCSHLAMRGALDLIRFGGHLPKGGYDVPNGGNEKPTASSAVHG